MMPCQWGDKHLVMAELVKGVGVIVTARLDNTTRWDCHTTESVGGQRWLVQQNQSQKLHAVFNIYLKNYLG